MWEPLLGRWLCLTAGVSSSVPRFDSLSWLNHVTGTQPPRLIMGPNLLLGAMAGAPRFTVRLQQLCMEYEDSKEGEARLFLLGKRWTDCTRLLCFIHFYSVYITVCLFLGVAPSQQLDPIGTRPVTPFWGGQCDEFLLALVAHLDFADLHLGAFGLQDL